MAEAKKAAIKPGDFVIFLTDRVRLGAPIRLAPSPDLPPSRSRQTTTRLEYAARFATRGDARKYLKFYKHPDYVCTVGVFREQDQPPPHRPSKDCQPALPFME